MQALVVVQQSELAALLVDALGKVDCEALVAADITSAMKLFTELRPPLVLVSCRLHELDGLAFCRQIRDANTYNPLMMMITGQNSATELQKLLDAGADDYLLYPILADLLPIRLQIATRRAQNRASAADVEQKLRESNERFEVAVRGSNEGLYDTWPRGKPWNDPDNEAWHSPRMKEMLGYSDEEFPPVIRSFFSRLHPDDRERTVKAMTEHIEHKKPYDTEYRLLAKSGKYIWFSARGQGTWDEQGRLVRMSGSLRDITQSKEDKFKLEQSEAKWRSLVENAPDLIILTDLDGTIKFINRTTGGFEETLGRSVFDYIDPEYWEVARQAHEAVCKTGQLQQYEARVHRPDGGTSWFATRLGPIWHDGRIESIVRIATDITHRKIAEQQLDRERQLLRRLLDLQERERQLVAYDIHDGLVQYLTGGLMHLEAAIDGPKGRKEKQQAEHDRGMSLLRDALAEARRLISGLRPPILDEQGVGAALEYLVNESRADIDDIEFVNLSYFGRLAAPLEVAIFRITQEALSNIRHHSLATKARVELVQHGQWVRLIIRDWGCGFNPQTVHEERFGLQGIRQRARLLGTMAVIESAPGQGATIVVDFPLILEEPAEKPEPI
jgi:PAS domain S-box-containing protein